ncbi:hypothetical protein Q3G72_000929 [Acer saccharum]|nr:hypothetical protein Q3G72_000929 [Acer saccharum]
MTLAKSLATQGAPHGTWVLAECQTAGRGRRGRTWQSQARGGVYMTLLLRPAASADLAGLSLVFGMAARTALLQTLKAHADVAAHDIIKLKWPNDIVVADRKLGGVLLEVDGLGSAQPVLRVGLGLNVAPADSLSLAPELAQRYIGLMQLAPDAHALPEAATAFCAAAAREQTEQKAQMWVHSLAQALVGTCYEAYTLWAQKGLQPTLSAWPVCDALLGRSVVAQTGAARVVGVAQGIGPDGRLKLASPAGCVWVDSGEVHMAAAHRANHGDLTQSGAAVYIGLTPEAR